MEIGRKRQRNTEYYVYDFLSFVGTVGGTLGLLVGFSFYDFIVKTVEFFCTINYRIKGASKKLLTKGGR